jgi:hypothetical protein
LILIILLASALATACAGAKTDGAGKAVESYFQAIVDGNADHAAAVSCADWSETARGEVASFVGVKARLDKLACKTVTAQGDQSTVTCSGAIIAKYVDQEQTFDLSGRQFKVSHQGEQWLVCGYGQ